MTTYSTNLRIPHLDQNVVEPEIPENTAKNIIDQLISGQFTLDIPTDADYTFVHTDSPTTPSDWQNGLIEIIDTTVPLTAPRDIILPNNKRTYIFVNSTTQALTFKVASQTGVTLSSGSNMFAICNGIDIEKLEFAAEGAGMYLGTLNDVPAGYGVAGQSLLTNGTNGFTYSNIDIGLSGDLTAGYGLANQSIISNGSDSFTYSYVVLSDPTLPNTDGNSVLNMVFLTTLQYEALATPNTSTFYIIKD